MKQNMTLGLQLHASKEILKLYQLSPIRSVKNVKNAAKPNYGFWTSSFTNKKHGSKFLKEIPMYDANWYTLSPMEANIFVVNDANDINHLLTNYGRINFKEYISYIDFEKLSMDFDALHLTNNCFVRGVIC
ncbi:hypothetical protein [Bacillus wiedmannii]|uniref:hypothetical protein n=1 Tax=Bacillus wiedmannii TaxID=1890302 RepID=UPI000BF0EFE6|nr:hypothetical protein [Bacillus wiedmannii]PEL85530.1 hypothetical protein CN626_27615 [Bacillus wiedmannii]